MNITLRDYQQDLYNKIRKELSQGRNRVLAQLETGGGKSVVIGHIANVLGGRTLILTHRAEILDQNSEWIPDVGILHAKKNTVGVNTRVVIAMVQTLDSRLKRYGVDYIGSFENVILDEVHVQIFQKVFDKYRPRYIIGFTATPITNKKSTIIIHGDEYTHTHTMSEQFDSIVTGISIQELIDRGFLVQDFNVSLKLPDFDNLRDSESTPDGYTYASVNEVYSNKASIKVLNDAIDKYCEGKKTLIFNATTKVNLEVYEALKERNLNVRMYDSVNSKSGREEVVEWFKSEREAILVGANVFTTGFNVTDIEVVIVNRATKSLSLWIQMVGRGGRPTESIMKDHFTVIDLGQNLERHGAWSMARNWDEYFRPQPPKKKRSVNLIETWACSVCGSLSPNGVELRADGEIYCAFCGAKKITSEVGAHKPAKDGSLVIVDDIPLPSGRKIVEYCKDVGLNSNKAFRILEDRILKLFSHYQVSRAYYLERREDFDKRVSDIFRPIYFSIIKAKLGGSHVTYESELNRVKSKILKFYKIDGEES